MPRHIRVQQRVVRFFSHVTRVYVGASAEYYGVYVLKGLEERFPLLVRRNEKGSAACRNNRQVVGLGKSGLVFHEIGRYANHGASVPCRIA